MPKGNGVRDPRSVEWDDAMRPILIAAIRAMRQRKGVVVWVASPRDQFRNKDGGGRTQEERAFTRCAYYWTWSVPNTAGVPRDYSLKLTWGDSLQPSSHGRRARACRVRLYKAGQGKRQPGAKEWVAEMQSTGDSSFSRSRETLNARQAPAPPRVRS
jgi:hypothetical protein